MSTYDSSLRYDEPNLSYNGGVVTSAPDVFVEIAFSSPPNTGSPIWTDVSGWVRSIGINRGRSSELEQYSAGRVSLVLDNRDRRFDPLHSGSPYAPNVLPRKQLRIRAVYKGTTYSLFTGFIEGWPQEYDQADTDATVAVTAIDPLAWLARIHMPTPWELEVKADTPNAWYRLGEAAGTVASDSSGNNHHGSYEGGLTFNSRAGLIASDPDNAIETEGLNAQRVIIPRIVGVSTDTWTIEAWASFETGSTGGTIYGQYVIGSQLQIHVDGTNGVKLTAVANGRVDTVTSTINVIDGRPHHIAVTCNAGSPAIYVDGIDRTAAGTAKIVTPLNTESTKIALGILPTFAGSSPLQGILDEVSIYNQALTSGRVSARTAAGTSPWRGELSSTRVTKLLSLVPYNIGTNVSTGKSTLASFAGADSVLEHLQQVATTEAGRFFIAADGKATFTDRHSIFSAARYRTSQATFGDRAGELPYQNVEIDFTADQVRNEIITDPQDYSRFVVSDEPSIDAYLRASYQSETLESDANKARDYAHYILGRYKDPQVRIRSIRVKPAASEAAIYPKVLGCDLGDRITVVRRPQGIGSPISQEVHIESINHSIAPGGNWVTTYTLSQAETRTYWRLGHATDGKLGTSTRLAF